MNIRSPAPPPPLLKIGVLYLGILHKVHYDKSARDDPLEEGDEVLVLHPARPRGLAAQWMGPYLVVEAISPVSYRIGTPGKNGAILHRNHLKRFVQSHHVSAVLLADGDIEDETTSSSLSLSTHPQTRRSL